MSIKTKGWFFDGRSITRTACVKRTHVAVPGMRHEKYSSQKREVVVEISKTNVILTQNTEFNLRK